MSDDSEPLVAPMYFPNTGMKLRFWMLTEDTRNSMPEPLVMDEEDEWL